VNFYDSEISVNYW